MSTSLWFPEPINLEEASLLGGLWRCLFGEVAWVASIWASKALPISRVACGAGALVAPGGHKYSKDFGSLRFMGRPSSATLGNAAIAEC